MHIVLGFLLIVVAFWNFEWGNWNRVIISTLLFLTGVYNLTIGAESAAIRKKRRVLRRLVEIATVLLILKILLYG
ncbi:MAG: hypothetical protein JSS81_25260 [Acidobacteria bacterium]|nr:hypothetical protein [Acidobacteriota bacterium]